MTMIEGLNLDRDVPAASRPRQSKVLMEDVAGVFTNGVPKARRGQDGTAWCVCCDVTVSPHPRSAFCTEHKTARNTILKRRRRDEGPATPRHVPKDAIDEVVEATDDLMESLGRATMQFPRLPPAIAEWVDDLMLRTKTLTRAVDIGLRPHSSHAGPRPSRATRPATRDAPPP